MFSKISKTLKITWELVPYIVITAQKYLDRRLRLRKDRLYSFAKALKARIKA